MEIDQFRNKILVGHVLESLRKLPSESIQCCVTSPPYFSVRNYSTNPQTWSDGWIGELGREKEPEQYVDHLVEIFEEVRRVLRKDGILWLNISSSYAGAGQGPTGKNGIGKQENRQGYTRGIDKTKLANFKPKDMIPIPWMVGLALQKVGWWLRSDCIWKKDSCMPASYTDRPTVCHEYILLLTKSKKYFYDFEAVKEPAKDWGGRDRSDGKYTSGEVPISGGAHRGLKDGNFANRGKNRRSVISINPRPFRGAHFACFPPELPLLLLKAGASTHGSCSKCGAPYERIIEKRKCETTKPRAFAKAGNEDRNDTGRIYEETETITTGWQSTCKCTDAGKVPCVILDPFGGSGTTAMIAKYLGMDYVLCELNPDYVKLAEKRIAEGYKPKKEKKIKKIKEANNQLKLNL